MSFGEVSFACYRAYTAAPDRHGRVLRTAVLIAANMLAVPPFNRLCWVAEDMGDMTMWRRTGPMDLHTAAAIMLTGLFAYAAWLTSIVFCASNGMRPLLIAAAAFFPVGMIHGIGVWFGG